MTDKNFSYINETFYRPRVAPAEMDWLLAHGWRHFGTNFFRYNLGFYAGEIRQVFPLRIRLANFTPSKSQRRICRKNDDLICRIQPIAITADKELLFDSHKRRFTSGTPDSIYDFLAPYNPAEVPGEALELGIYSADKLIAVSFFDVGADSVSSIYAMFDETEAARSLGIFTMLGEIEFARRHNKTFYYQGYCYAGKSFYDYKKRFSALEMYDWHSNWTAFRES